MSESPGHKIVAQNRKARFSFHILDRFEAGIMLSGAEVKSIREGKISLQESYIKVLHNAAYLVGAHIPAYTRASKMTTNDYNPTRERKLLLHQREIDKLRHSTEAKGMTVVALAVYFKNGRAKVDIALAKGKNVVDKRETVKKREAEREMAKALRGKPKDRR